MKKKIAILAPIIVMLIITILSGFSGDYIIGKLKENFGQLYFIKNQIESLFKIDVQFSLIQNLMHIPAFALIAFLWAIFFYENKKIGFYKAGLFAALLTFLFGILDEVHQLFVYGRDASFGDLMLDLLGIILGIWALAMIKKLKIESNKDVVKNNNCFQ